MYRLSLKFFTAQHTQHWLHFSCCYQLRILFNTERQPPAPWTQQSQKNHLQKREVITGRILRGPRNITVFEGSTVSFNCTGSATVEAIVWNVNDLLNISMHIDSGLIVSTLFMVAHHQYNGTAVWCGAICGGELCGRSEEAVLTVKSESEMPTHKNIGT